MKASESNSIRLSEVLSQYQQTVTNQSQQPIGPVCCVCLEKKNNLTIIEVKVNCWNMLSFNCDETVSNNCKMKFQSVRNLLNL